MIPTSPSEHLVETVANIYFSSRGYSVLLGAQIDDAGERADLARPLLEGRVAKAIHRLHPQLPHDEVEQVLRVLRRPPLPTLIQNNRWFHEQLTAGIEVSYRDPTTGENRGGRARLMDFENPANNDLLVVRQLVVTNATGTTIRPDLTVFLNGFPIALFELKDPADPHAGLDVAINQMRRYMEKAPDFFMPNAMLVASDGLLTRVGAITSGLDRFMPWRPDAGGEPTLETLIRGLFEPSQLLDYLRNCVVFQEDERGEIAKKIAGYHQFRAVRNTRAAVLQAIKPPAGSNTSEDAGKGGVVWHTQGSGKSLTMLMLAGALVQEPALANPTIVVVTDRNDLDNQLFDTFATGHALLRQTPVQAESRDHLKQLLDRAAGGVVFTTIQKFTEDHGTLSERANVVVMADEAHRSQYGFVEGGAKWMRDALPNATFVGFTGTPLDRDDRSTPRVFGAYADIYDVRQAVEDGATKPLLYESRIVKLTVDDEGVAEAEREIEEATAASREGTDAPENVRVPLEALVGAPERLTAVAAFLVDHWEQRRDAMEGKAMVVTMSRDIAARLYEEIKALRPAWPDADDAKGAMKVVVTGSADDPEPLQQHVRTAQARKNLAARFKNPDDDFRLAIVVDMWLTGFDVPCAHTMYLDKPLAGHNLMQAIARVNRVYGEKPGGLIVDMLGLADQFADALATYANASGQDEAAFKQVQDEAVPAMQSAFEKLQAFFSDFDYASALAGDQTGVLRVYVNAIDYVLAQHGENGESSADVSTALRENPGRRRLRKLVKELSAAFALAVPRPETDVIAPHLAFYQRLVAMMQKRLADESDSRERARARDVDAAVRQVIGGAVDAGQVIDLFEAAGLDSARLDILSEDFLQRVSALEQKNLALETLRKLLNDQVRVTERKNLVLSRQFREALEDAMLSYTNRQISTAEMISRLLDLARWVREQQQRGEALGLSDEEAAFYDALAENGSAREVMKSDTLRLMARKLSEMIKEMPKLDWAQRESVRADLRRKVRRLLALYGYPPDLSEDATQLVLRQAELSTDESDD
ncbi:MAG: type I restriction endonuclease [Planctomycetaceae bacterium]|nr:type I restriction endonuclease [Planctomycetaceae bacterium]